MASLGKLYPHYVIDAVNCTDAKLERLKFVISFTIADILWVKKQDNCMLTEDTKN